MASPNTNIIEMMNQAIDLSEDITIKALKTGMLSGLSEEKIRELIHPPFRVVYLREFDSIHLIRVWRSERILRLPDESET